MDSFKTPELVVEETGRKVPEQQAYLNLIRTAEVLGLALGDLLAEHGLSGKQYNILRAVRRGGKGGAVVSQIGQQMTDPRADVTRLLDRLERDALIERRHDEEDRRVVRVHLTAKGARQLRSLDAPIVDLHKKQFGHLSSRELADLTALLRKARKAKD